MTKEGLCISKGENRMEKLLPCPFCGHEVELKSLGGDGQNWAIICLTCNCACSEMGVSGETKEEIIKAWNRRDWNP